MRQPRVRRVVQAHAHHAHAHWSPSPCDRIDRPAGFAAQYALPTLSYVFTRAVRLIKSYLFCAGALCCTTHIVPSQRRCVYVWDERIANSWCSTSTQLPPLVGLLICASLCGLSAHSCRALIMPRSWGRPFRPVELYPQDGCAHLQLQNMLYADRSGFCPNGNTTHTQRPSWRHSPSERSSSGSSSSITFSCTPRESRRLQQHTQPHHDHTTHDHHTMCCSRTHTHICLLGGRPTQICVP